MLGIPMIEAEVQFSDVAEEGQARRHTATLQVVQSKRSSPIRSMRCDMTRLSMRSSTRNVTGG